MWNSLTLFPGRIFQQWWKFLSWNRRRANNNATAGIKFFFFLFCVIDKHVRESIKFNTRVRYQRKIGIPLWWYLICVFTCARFVQQAWFTRVDNSDRAWHFKCNLKLQLRCASWGKLCKNLVWIGNIWNVNKNIRLISSLLNDIS